MTRALKLALLVPSGCYCVWVNCTESMTWAMPNLQENLAGWPALSPSVEPVPVSVHSDCNPYRKGEK